MKCKKCSNEMVFMEGGFNQEEFTRVVYCKECGEEEIVSADTEMDEEQ